MTAALSELLPWTDYLTIMCAPGKRLAKLVHADGTVKDYDSPYRFNADAVPVSSLLDVADHLNRLLVQPDRCVVRGELVAGASARNIRRMVHADDETGDAPTLRDVSRRWLALDADGVARPDEVRADDLLACADAVIGLLPTRFHRAACIVQATGSHGIKPGSRLRLWYWCDRPMTGAEMKRWLADAPVDRSVFNAAQPIYTAAPKFAPRINDHLSYRLIEWPGEDWLRCPCAAELEPPPPRPTPEFVSPVCAAGSSRAQLYADGAKERASERIRNANLRHPAILQEACGLARFVNAGLMTKTELHDALWSAAQCAGKDDEAEIKRIVAFGIAHPDPNPIPVEVQDG